MFWTYYENCIPLTGIVVKKFILSRKIIKSLNRNGTQNIVFPGVPNAPDPKLPNIGLVDQLIFYWFLYWLQNFISIKRFQTFESSWTNGRGGGCVAQRWRYWSPPSGLGFESQLSQDFFSLLLSLRTVLRSKPSSAMQWISQMQLAVTSRVKYFKKVEQMESPSQAKT